MIDITYCSHVNCYYRDCTRHQSHAPTDRPISITDLNDGYCFSPKQDPIFKSSRDDLLSAICKGVQNTSYKCDNPTRALCDVDGGCYFCDTIANAVKEVLNETR